MISMGHVSKSTVEEELLSAKDNTSVENSGDVIGSASDYILIAMIVAMMFCMTICCLCLFCRSASRFTVCGFNFEMNNPTSTLAPEDLSELHEVMPLTPTTAGNCQLPDIENMLRSDPPPPHYSEVTSSSMRDRFRWRSRRKHHSNNDQKRRDSSKPVKNEDTVNLNKNRQIAVKSRTRLPFQRSVSYQQTRSSFSRPGAPVAMSVSSEEPKSTRKNTLFPSFRIRSTRIPQSASESAMEASWKGPAIKVRQVIQESPITSVKFDLLEPSVERIDTVEKKNDESTPHERRSYGDDDEVFL